MKEVRITAIVFAAIVCCWMAGAVMAAGDGAGVLYEWKDDRGVVNVADDISKVPDKYRLKARKLGQSGPGNTVQEQQPQESSVSDEAADKAMQDEDVRKAEWQQRMHDAKRRLTDAEDRYSQIVQRRNELASQWGSSGAALPPQNVLDEMNRLDGEMTKAKIEADRARNEVDVVIPEDARKASVPPGWLREVQ